MALWIAIVTAVSGIIIAIVQTWKKESPNSRNSFQQDNEPDDDEDDDEAEAKKEAARWMTLALEETGKRCELLQDLLDRERASSNDLQKRFTKNEVDRALEIQKAEYDVRMARLEIAELERKNEHSESKLKEAQRELREQNKRLDNMYNRLYSKVDYENDRRDEGR